MSTTTAPKPNVPLLREVANWIRHQAALASSGLQREYAAIDDPQSTPDLIWNQGIWVGPVWGSECQTACCIAGYVALTDSEVDAQKTRSIFSVVTRNNRYFTFEEYAQKKLGLTALQASRLFYMSDYDHEQVIDLLSEIAGEEL